MAKNSLEAIFGSALRVRTLRFFIRNPHAVVSVREVSPRLKFPVHALKRELGELERIGFLKETSRKIGKRRMRAWKLEPSFEFLGELTPLLLTVSSDFYERFERDVKKLGRVRLAVIGGIFTYNPKTKADLLIVLSHFSKRRLNSFIQNLEAEMGAELRCAVMDPKEFEYRIKLYDRFLREMLDRKNRRIINKIGRV